MTYTKEQFVEAIKLMEREEKAEENLRKAIKALSVYDSYIETDIYTGYEAKLIETIKSALGVSEEDGTLEYFVYDLDFGKDYVDGCISVDGVNIDLSTSEKLYDYLISIAK